LLLHAHEEENLHKTTTWLPPLTVVLCVIPWSSPWVGVCFGIPLVATVPWHFIPSTSILHTVHADAFLRVHPLICYPGCVNNKKGHLLPKVSPNLSLQLVIQSLDDPWARYRICPKNTYHLGYPNGCPPNSAIALVIVSRPTSYHIGCHTEVLSDCWLLKPSLGFPSDMLYMWLSAG
jgi:hypothetical protein